MVSEWEAIKTLNLFDHLAALLTALLLYRHVSNKLHSVKPLLGYSSLSSLSRQDADILSIGHTRLTHSNLLNRQDQPECSHCDYALTVAHVLLECNHYSVVRQRYFNVSRSVFTFIVSEKEWVSEQFLNGTSAQYRLCSAILLKSCRH